MIGLKFSLAASLFQSTTAIWWYSVTETPELKDHVPESWVDSRAALRREFIPQNNQQMARDHLRTLYQHSSVAEYIDELRNIILSIPGISEEKKLDSFLVLLQRLPKAARYTN